MDSALIDVIAGRRRAVYPVDAAIEVDGERFDAGRLLVLEPRREVCA